MTGKRKTRVLHTTEKGYTISQSKDRKSIYCSCPAWKFQHKAPADRTCKHLTAYAVAQAHKVLETLDKNKIKTAGLTKQLNGIKNLLTMTEGK